MIVQKSEKLAQRLHDLNVLMQASCLAFQTALAHAVCISLCVTGRRLHHWCVNFAASSSAARAHRCLLLGLQRLALSFRPRSSFACSVWTRPCFALREALQSETSCLLAGTGRFVLSNEASMTLQGDTLIGVDAEGSALGIVYIA